MLTGSVLLTCAGNKREKAAQRVLPHCLPGKQPWPRHNVTPESRAACHPRCQCRGFSCKYFSIAWLILWTGTNSSYARGWNKSLSNSVLCLLQLTFCLHTKLPLLLVNLLSSSEVFGSVYLPKTCRLYISEHWCKMLRHWNETVSAKKSFSFSNGLLHLYHLQFVSLQTEVPNNYGNKTWSFYYFRVFSEKNAVWTFLSTTTHNSYSKSRKLIETYTYIPRGTA